MASGFVVHACLVFTVTLFVFVRVLDLPARGAMPPEEVVDFFEVVARSKITSAEVARGRIFD